MGALISSGIAAFLLSAYGAGAIPARADTVAAERDKAAFVEAMKPHRPGKPVIVVLARNEATETTDFLLTHAVLQRADIADVQAVAPRRGRVLLYPVLQIEVTQDLASFDRSHPAGADYVVVPAMEDEKEPVDPAITGWLKQQADKGARIIGVCAGALVVGRAGLLDDRRFVTHWYFRKMAQERYPTATFVPNQRYVIDRHVATTTGITASVPSMIALVEAIGGREKARALAAELGATSWTPAHDSSAFGLNVVRGWHYLLNKVAFWRDQKGSIDVQDGTDDIALALVADAWSRTGHVDIAPVSTSNSVTLRSGLVLATQPPTEGATHLPLTSGLKPLQQLDRTLCEIGERYGKARREWVMMELEYPDTGGGCGLIKQS